MGPVVEACRTAKRDQTVTIVKPSSCDHLPEDLLTSIDILMPGPRSVMDKTRRFIDGGVGKVIVTLGERGCTLVTPNGHKDFPAHRTRVIDDTGAGDAFISALAAYLCNGRPLDEAFRIAKPGRWLQRRPRRRHPFPNQPPPAGVPNRLSGPDASTVGKL